MKFSYIALFAISIFTTIFAYTGPDYHYNLKLYVEYLPQNVGKDGYEPVDGKFLQAVRIDPETYLFVLGDADEAATIQYDYLSDEAYIVDDNVPFYVTTDTYHNLIATSKFSSDIRLYGANSARTVFEYIKVVSYSPNQNIYSFTPKKNIGDRIGYSNDHYALVGNTDGYDKGALIHYEVLGADTGNGVGILNPSSISATQEASYTTTLSSIEFGTDVYTTNPPTVPISTGTISDPLESGYLADDFGLRVSESGSSVSTTETSDSSSSSTGSGNSLASKTSSASNKSSESSQTGTTTASGKSTASGTSSTSPSSASSGSASSSNTAVNPKTLLKNKASGRSVAGGAGVLALFAAVL